MSIFSERGIGLKDGGIPALFPAVSGETIAGYGRKYGAACPGIAENIRPEERAPEFTPETLPGLVGRRVSPVSAMSKSERRLK